MVPDSESVLSQSDKQFGYNANARRFDDADLSWRFVLLFTFEFEFELIFNRLLFVELDFFNWLLSINLSDCSIIIVESFVDSISFKSTFGCFSNRVVDWSGCGINEGSEDDVGT